MAVYYFQFSEQSLVRHKKNDGRLVHANTSVQFILLRSRWRKPCTWKDRSRTLSFIAPLTLGTLTKHDDASRKSINRVGRLMKWIRNDKTTFNQSQKAESGTESDFGTDVDTKTRASRGGILSTSDQWLHVTQWRNSVGMTRYVWNRQL